MFSNLIWFQYNIIKKDKFKKKIKNLIHTNFLWNWKYFNYRHGTEPAVNLTFSEESTRTGQIRLDVANRITPPELQTSQSRQMEIENSNAVAGPSHQAVFPKRETSQPQQQPFNSSQSNHSEDDEGEYL